MIAFGTYVTPHYKQILRQVKHKAFRFRIDEADLLSKVHERMGGAIERGLTFEHTNLFWKYMRVLILSSAIDTKRSVIPADNIEFVIVPVESTTETKMSARVVMNDVLDAIRLPRRKEVFVAVVIEGEGYREVAERLDININTVKSIINETRVMANKKFKQDYLDIVA